MSEVLEKPGAAKGEPAPPSRKDRAALATVATVVVIAAASWYLLGQLAVVLRPLLLAVLLCCLLLPAHRYLRRWLPSLASVGVLAGAVAGILYMLALLLYGSAVELNEEVPHLLRRAREIREQWQQVWAAHAPAWLASDVTHAVAATTDGAGLLPGAVHALINGAAAALGDALVVGVYLLFLLLEAGRFPGRVRRAFPDARAEQILKVMADINGPLLGYLRVQIQVSLLLAALVTLVLAAFGVKFALMWGLLTFAANFIPYVGSIIAYSLPVLFTFLQLDPGWQPLAVALLLLACHGFVAYVLEPALAGRAVGLSPLVVLIALAFWGQCWGLMGMVLAVPVTVMLKIVLENLTLTRPFARLLEEH
jgi:AI-2 transport protein TqsA